jgi:hypothetical protein
MIGKTDQWSGLVLFIFSGLIFWWSTRLPYGDIHDPGPGFLPLWLSLSLGVLSVGLLLISTLQKEGAKRLKDLLAEKIRWGKVLYVVIALFLYAYLIEYIGFLTVTFLFMAFLLRFIDPQRWRAVIAWALVASVGSYLIFEVWMKLRLPKGFLGV